MQKALTHHDKHDQKEGQGGLVKMTHLVKILRGRLALDYQFQKSYKASLCANALGFEF